MGLVIFRHGQDRDHGDTSDLASLTACAFIHLSQVSVHVSGVSASSGNLFFRSGDLTESVRVVCNIGQDNQYVHIFFKRQVLCCRQRHTGRGDTFYRRVIRQVDKQYGTVNGSCFLKGFYEEVGLFKCNTHCREYNGEVLVFAKYLCLSCDLRRQLIVRQTGTGEDRQLLSTYQCVQSVDGGHAGLDKLGRVYTGRRVHRQAVDISSLFRKDLRSVVNGASQSVKDTAQHISGYAKFHAASQETHLTVA